MKNTRFLSSAILTSLMICVLISCDKDDTPLIDSDNPFRTLLASMDWGHVPAMSMGTKYQILMLFALHLPMLN